MSLISIFLLPVALAFGDETQVTPSANTWVKLDNARIGPRSDPALVFDPAARRFLLLGGGIAWPIYGKQPHPFDDLALDQSAGKWENVYPAGKNWGPRFGDAAPPVFKNEVFDLLDVEGNVRPNLSTYRGVFYYNQYAYDSDGKRVYFHARGHTFCYDPATRVWRDLAPATSPAGGPDQPPLLWSSMCYDPVNRQVLLFGGGNVLTERGDPGTWVYDPPSNIWSQLQFRSVALEGLRKQCEELQAKSKVLAEAVRARHFHAELPEQKPVSLADDASRLIADIALLSAALTKAEGQADKQEKLQIAWARHELDTAMTELKLTSRSLGQKTSAEMIHIVESARNALGQFVSDAARSRGLVLSPDRSRIGRPVANGCREPQLETSGVEGKAPTFAF
jgi:hypothetical protein